MRIYHSPGTRSTRALWLLEELGEPYDVTILTKEERQADAHRAIHPLGRVPAMDDGKGIVIESSAICLQIADLRPEAGLNWPLGTHERALVYQWSFYAMLEVEMPIVDIFRAKETHPDVATEAEARFRTHAQILEDALAGKEYLVGDRFSVADVIAGSVLGFAKFVELLDGLPNCVAYVQRLDARPSRVKAQAIGR